MLKSKWALLLALLLSVINGPAWCGFSTLAGLWDISGKTVLRADFDGLKLKNPAQTVRYMTQFNDDASWSSYYGLAYGVNVTVPGNWSLSGRNFAVSLDSTAGADLLPNYLSFIETQFADLVKAIPGPNVTVTGITVTSYTESGKLSRNGLRLKGRSRITGEISFVMLDTSTPNRNVTAGFVATTRYTGVRASAPSTCCTDAHDNSAESAAFLTDNLHVPGVRQTASGLQYKVLRAGTGVRPSYPDYVIMSYRGILPNGNVFGASSDSNGPTGTGFPLSSSEVIKGWIEGLQLMREGAWYRFYVPPNLGLGSATSRNNIIKPNSALIFDVHLLKVNP